jgi:hypothetical protein
MNKLMDGMTLRTFHSMGAEELCQSSQRGSCRWWMKILVCALAILEISATSPSPVDHLSAALDDLISCYSLQSNIRHMHDKRHPEAVARNMESLNANAREVEDPAPGFARTPVEQESCMTSRIRLPRVKACNNWCPRLDAS